ncbi:MAG: hypothetical protein ONB17_03505 [candidate division KSB1 bacterium]|nr:hypothetical protein [candidate division KSB1 bacterium]MDZ7295566.1 hypothetical protein [candidate division KSB1 bacterium]
MQMPWSKPVLGIDQLLSITQNWARVGRGGMALPRASYQENNRWLLMGAIDLEQMLPVRMEAAAE